MKTLLPLCYKTPACLLLAIGFLSSGAVPAANASLILNGSFELPGITANTTSSTVPTSWTKVGSLNPLIFNGNPLSGFPSPQNGNQFVDIGNPSFNAAISQGFSVTTPGSYQLTWFDNAATGAAAGYRVDLLNSSSVVIATASQSLVGGSSWNSRSLTGTLGLGSYTLKFTPSTGLDTLLDNVSLDAVAVPEPTTMIAGALMLLPFGISTLRVLRKPRKS